MGIRLARKTKDRYHCDLCFRKMMVGDIHFTDIMEADYEFDFGVTPVRLCNNHIKELHTLFGIILKAKQEENEHGVRSI